MCKRSSIQSTIEYMRSRWNRISIDILQTPSCKTYAEPRGSTTLKWTCRTSFRSSRMKHFQRCRKYVAYLIGANLILFCTFARTDGATGAWESRPPPFLPFLPSSCIISHRLFAHRSFSFCAFIIP